jgi:microcystin degradation protein MlrC
MHPTGGAVNIVPVQGRTLRIAVGGISLESNDFVPFTAELTDFTDAGFLAEGEAIFELAESELEIAGALARLDQEPGLEIAPLLSARGVSSGRVSEPAYTRLRSGLLDALRKSLPVDGVYLFLHGSMEAVGEDDPEADLASAIRELVGTDVPLVVSCDLHANVTRRLVEATDAILGYEHYPHDDTRQTGFRAADLLLRIVRREAAPAMAHAKLSLLLTAFHSTTLIETPFARLMAEAKALEDDPKVLSASVFLVGSYLDAPDLGCSALVISDGDLEFASREARRLALAFWQRRFEFEVESLSVREAVRRGRQIPGGPVLLLDTADTTGGGAAGDSIGLVRGLLDAGVSEPTLAMVVDPEAAAACHRAGSGAAVELDVGHKRDRRWGEPLRLRARVERLSDGRFRYRSGILGGVEVTMGLSAVLAVEGIRLLVMSAPTYDWGDDQYRALGLGPSAAKFVGVKNMMNFRFGYGDVMKAFFVLDLPGPTPPDMRQLPFQRLRRPIFPLDYELEDPGLQMATSTRFQPSKRVQERSR